MANTKKTKKIASTTDLKELNGFFKVEGGYLRSEPIINNITLSSDEIEELGDIIEDVETKLAEPISKTRPFGQVIRPPV